jgi:SRSO17 transposase
MFIPVDPEEVLPELERFRGFFTRPQYPHFKRYMLGLITHEKTKKNIQSINNEFIDAPAQSSLNRFLVRSNWNSSLLNTKRIKLFVEDKCDGILVLDDSPIEKTGKQMEGVGYVYSHSAGKIVLAHDMVSTLYVNGSGEHPLHFELYLKEEVASKLGKKFKTKIEIAEELIDRARWQVSPEAITFDAWYFANELVKFLEEKDMDWVARSKLNRRVFYDGEWVRLEDLLKALPRDSFSEVDEEIEDEKYRYRTSLVADMNGVGMVKLVVLKKDVEDEEGIVLVSNRLDWRGGKIVGVYKKRHCIEVFYRDCKQHLGLGEYQMRSMSGIVRHLSLVFLAYSLLENARLRDDLVEFSKSAPKTIGELCRAVRNAATLGFAFWVFQLSMKLNDPNALLMVLKSYLC